MENKPQTTHPMIIVAATAVTIASLVAIASFAGWLPGNRDNAATSGTQVATAPVVAPEPPAAATAIPSTPATIAPATPAVHKKPVPVRRKASSTQADSAYNDHGATPIGNYPMNGNNSGFVDNSRQPPQNSQNPSTCRDCATVESVREVKQEGEGSGLGAISGGVVGGLLGNQIGGGRGKTVGAVVGAVGGAFAGNQVEKSVRSTKHFEITVRLDDGSTRVFTESQPPSLQHGDRVRINNGQLSRM